MLRMLVRSALICLGASLSAVLLGLLGAWWIAIFTSVGFGFLGMSVGDRWLAPRRGSTTFAAFAGLLIVTTAGILSLASVEVRLWPAHASGLTLEQAQQDSWASSFALRGARVEPKLGGQAAVLGRYGNTLDTASVVPVVDDAWKPEDPILVWAVARRATHAEREALWQKPLGIGVRVTGFYGSDYEKAVKAACSAHRLRSSREPLFIDWTPSPRASWQKAWRKLGTIAGLAALALWMLNVLVRLLQPASRA